jgi:hypothetical protein
MLTNTLGHTEIGGMNSVFLGTLEIVINIDVQFFFVLLGGFLHLNETVMRGRDDFLADLALNFSTAGMSFE